MKPSTRLNPMIECNCGCGNFTLQFDNRGRERKFIKNHGHGDILKGKKHSSSTKIKMSNAWSYEKHNTESIRLSISKANIGHIGWMLGKTRTKESVNRAVESRKKSADRRGYYHSNETKDKIKSKRLVQIIPKKDTIPERMMQLALQIKGIKFEKHKSITGQPDIFIEPNIALFVDGCYWHFCQDKGCKQGRNNVAPNSTQMNKIINDNSVNHDLNELGYIVIRVWEHSIHENADMLAHSIMKSIAESYSNNRKIIRSVRDTFCRRID